MNNSISFFHKIRAMCRTMRKAEWQLQGFPSMLRSKTSPKHCPITFVAYKELGINVLPSNVRNVSSRLMLNHEETLQIIMAADNSSIFITEKQSKKLRRIFLKAVGLYN